MKDVQRLNIQQGVTKGIFDTSIEKTLPVDTLEKVGELLNLIRTKYKVNVLIQSDLSTDRLKESGYQCMIGRRLDDYELAQVFSNGTGTTIGEAIVNSINEFIRYFGTFENDLLDI